MAEMREPALTGRTVDALLSPRDFGVVTIALRRAGVCTPPVLTLGAGALSVPCVGDYRPTPALHARAPGPQPDSKQSHWEGGM